MYVYIYIYIYIWRERERCLYLYVYIYIYIYICICHRRFEGFCLKDGAGECYCYYYSVLLCIINITTITYYYSDSCY